MGDRAPRVPVVFVKDTCVVLRWQVGTTASLRGGLA